MARPATANPIIAAGMVLEVRGDSQLEMAAQLSQARTAKKARLRTMGHGDAAG